MINEKQISQDIQIKKDKEDAAIRDIINSISEYTSQKIRKELANGMVCVLNTGTIESSIGNAVSLLNNNITVYHMNGETEQSIGYIKKEDFSYYPRYSIRLSNGTLIEAENSTSLQYNNGQIVYILQILDSKNKGYVTTNLILGKAIGRTT